MDENYQNEGEKYTHTLTRKEYNEKIGAQRQRRWNGLRRREK